MKRYTQSLRLALLATTLVVSSIAFAQPRQNQISTPQNGFWVVESQPKKPCVVSFYNKDNQLVYQETLTKKKLNLNRTTTRESLNSVLEKALQQWTLHPQPANSPLAGNQRWLAAEFGN
ncbi:hypothetical protein ACO2Q8_19545 [Larkinella sp. VNQ87]|uniref:hypothetical protein n=1 Tax=Larkinella sp. VNQ87 TaxID=3400921 RepID=UPI003C10E5D1